MKETIEKFQEYVAIYTTLDACDNPEIFIRDMIYGIGISISKENESADGYKKFKKELMEIL